MLRPLQQQIEAFWPYYVTQHLNQTNRRLHFIGNTYLLAGLALAVIRRSPRLAAWVVASAYGVAWIGHFGFERNIPATFRYPVLAGLCDLRMYVKMWRGAMDAEIARYGPPAP